MMKQHTVIGDRLCGELRSLRLVRRIIRQHHERLDGSGYPDGLRDDGSVLAQIVSTVDLYDAVTSARPYRPALPPEYAFTSSGTKPRAACETPRWSKRSSISARSGDLKRHPHDKTMPSVIKDSGVATSLTDPTTSDTVIPPDFWSVAAGPSTGLWRRFAATADSPGRVWRLPF